MNTMRNPSYQSFLPFTTFISHKKKLIELKADLHIKKTTITEARRILDNYLKVPQKLSDDILKMREE